MCFFYYPLGIEIDPKKPLKMEWLFLPFDVFLGTCYQDGSKGPPVGWECVPRTTSARIPTQHPETSAEAHTELARAEFPILGGAAMTRRRRLQ